MSRGSYRFRQHTLSQDPQEPIVHTMACKQCGASGSDSEEPRDGTEWATAHLKGNPDHLTYRETITRSYRAVPGEWI